MEVDVTNVMVKVEFSRCGSMAERLTVNQETQVQILSPVIKAGSSVD